MELGLLLVNYILDAEPGYNSDEDLAALGGASPSETVVMRTKPVRGRNLSNQKKDVVLVLNSDQIRI